MSLFEFDINAKTPELTMYLATPNKNKIGILSEAKDRAGTFKLGQFNEITFRVPKYITVRHEKRLNPNYENLRVRYLVEAKYLLFDEWLMITQISKTGGKNPTKTVTVKSLQYELHDKRIAQYQEESVNPRSAMTAAVRESTWAVGDVDPELAGLYRSFEESTTTSLQLLYKIAETFGGVLEFDTYLRTVHLRKQKNIQVDLGLALYYGKYIKSIEHDNDGEAVVTRLYVEGKDGITINALNPTGANYIEDYSYFMQGYKEDSSGKVISSSPYMSDALCKAIIAYDKLVASSEGVFKSLLDELDPIHNTWMEKSTELFNLELELLLIEDRLDIAKAAGHSYDDILIEQTAKKSQIDAKQSEIDDLNTDITIIENDIQDLRESLSIENNFTPELIKERNYYIIQDEWIDTNYFEEEELYEEAKEILAKSKEPKQEMTFSMVQFLELVEAQRDWNKIGLGYVISVNHDPLDIVSKSIITNFTINFDSKNISVGISNTTYKTSEEEFAEMLYKTAISTSQRLDMDSVKWNEAANKANEAQQILEGAWDAADRRIQAGVDETIEISRRGIRATSSLFPNEMLIIQSGVLALSKNGGQDWQTAITADGVVAERLFGRMIVGQNLFMENDSGKLRFDDKGLSLERQDEMIRTSINTVDGFRIERKFDGNYEDVFYVDSEGRLYARGLIIDDTSTLGGYTVDEILEAADTIVTDDKIENKIPAKVANLNAVGGFDIIQLSWGFIGTISIAHYEIHASQEKNFLPSESTLIAATKSSGYNHKVDRGETWYYRVRAVNTHKVAGAYSDEASATTEGIMTDDILFGAITAEKLANMSITAEKLSQGVSEDLENAKQNAQDAFEKANESVETSNTAITKADESFTKAQDALTSATGADSKAEQALVKAQDGFDKAQQAITSASGADSKAEQALSKAQEGFDKAQESFDKIDGLSIGGRNYFSPRKFVENRGSTLYKVSDDGALTITGTDSVGVETYAKMADLEPDTMYTISFSKPMNSRFVLINADGESVSIAATWNKDNTIGYFTTNEDTVAIKGKFVLLESANTNYPIDVFVKLEKGNKATDWSPAPEDTDQKIQVVADDLNGLSVEVSNNKGEIASVKQTAQGLQTKVQNAEGNISDLIQTADGLQTRVQNAEGEISTVKQTAQGLQSRVETVENWEIGGRNLILNSKNIGISRGDGSDGVLSFSKAENLILIEAISNKSITQNFYDTAFANSWVNKEEIFSNIQQGIPYTLSMEIRYKGSSKVHIGFDTRGVNGAEYARSEKITDTNGKWVRLSATKVETGRSVNTQSLLIGWFDSVKTGDTLEIRNIKLEQGNKPTDWTPAPEDTDQKFSSITQTVNGIQTEVGKKVNTTTYNSKMTQLDNLISQKVSQTDADGRYTQQSVFNQFKNGFSQRVEQIENWELGGRNLMDNTDFSIKNNIERLVSISAVTVDENSPTDYDAKFARARRDVESGTAINIQTKNDRFDIVEGNTYTLSFAYIVPVGMNPDMTYTYLMSDLSENTNQKLNITKRMEIGKAFTSFTVYKGIFTFTANWSDPAAWILIGSHATASGSLWIRVSNPKLEKGSKATDWSPSPTDIANGITIGGRNLITLEDPTMSGVTRNGYVYRLSKTGINNPYIRIPYTLFENETDYVISFKAKKISGSVYSMAGHVESIPDTASTVIILDGNEVSKGETWSTGNRNHPDDTETHEYEIRFKTTNNVAGGGSTKYWYIQPNRSSYSSNFVLDIWDWKLEKGTKKTGWSPAPEDYEEKFTAINQDINSISTRVQTNANNYSTLTQTVSGIQTTVSNKADKSTVTQLAGVVDTKISTVDANNKFATQSQLTQTSNSLTSTITSVRNDLDNIDINPLEGGGKIFTLPLSHRTGTSTVTGALVIKTPITSTYMTRIELSGYNYLGDNSDIDLVVSFYAYSGNKFMNHSYTSKGNYPISKVRLARDNGGRTVLIIGETNSKWSYPQIAVDKALVGYSTPPDSYKSGWSVSYLTNISAYTDVIEVSGADTQSEISTINQTVSSITTRVSNSEGQISSLSQTVSGIKTTVSNKAEKSEVTQLASTVSTKITSAQAQTLINQTTNSIVSRVEKIENSTGNLVKNPELTGNLTGWNSGGGLRVMTSTLDEFAGTKVLRNETTSNTVTYSEWFDVDPSKSYEISMWVRKSAQRGRWYLGVHGTNKANGTTNDLGFTGVSKSGIAAGTSTTNFYFVTSSSNARSAWVKLVGYLMPNGTSGKDMAGLGENNQNNAIMSPNLKRVRVRWLNYENGGTNTYMYVAHPKVVEVSSGSLSQISQLDNAINLRVEKGDVVNQINVSTEGILIDGKKIHITGDTSIDNAAIGTAAIANAAITNAKIINLAISTAKIQSGAITNAKIGNLAVDSAKIADAAITNAKIADATITSAKIYSLDVNKLSGMTSTFISTLWNGMSSQVSITGSGLETYSGGQRTSLLNGSGQRFYRNNLFVGHIGTSNWSGDSNYRGLRFGLENNADYMSWGFTKTADATTYTTMLAWHKTGSKSNKGFTFSDHVTMNENVEVFGNLRAVDYVSTNRLMTNYGSNSRELKLENFTSTIGSWSSSGVALVRGSGGGKVNFNTDSLVLWGGGASLLLRKDNTSALVLSASIYNRTYSGQSQVVITSSGTLGRLTSASKYKLSIEKQFADETEQLNHSRGILDLDIKTWFDKAEAETLAEECKVGKKLNTDNFTLKRHTGLIAEDVERAGLSEHVIYNEDGEIEGISYDRLPIHLIPVVKDHDERIQELEQEINYQQQTIDNLQLKIAQMEAKG